MNTQIKFTTPEEAVKVIKSGDHVHLSSVASAPQCLINAMCKRGEAGELKDVHIHHLHTEGPAPGMSLVTLSTKRESRTPFSFSPAINFFMGVTSSLQSSNNSI